MAHLSSFLVFYARHFFCFSWNLVSCNFVLCFVCQKVTRWNERSTQTHTHTDKIRLNASARAECYKFFPKILPNTILCVHRWFHDTFCAVRIFFSSFIWSSSLVYRIIQLHIVFDYYVFSSASFCQQSLALSLSMCISLSLSVFGTWLVWKCQSIYMSL